MAPQRCAPNRLAEEGAPAELRAGAVDRPVHHSAWRAVGAAGRQRLEAPRGRALPQEAPPLGKRPEARAAGQVRWELAVAERRALAVRPGPVPAVEEPPRVGWIRPEDEGATKRWWQDRPCTRADARTASSRR